MYGNFKTFETPYILGIESSCDETAAAVICGRRLLSNVIASSAPEQAKYGGVVPEIASRAHGDAIDGVVRRAIEEAGIKKEQINAVAVTYGAGLLGSLLVGLSFAKSFAYSLNIPLIGVNHIRGHLAAAYLTDENLAPPYVTLLASGGHTAILYTKSYTEFKVLKKTCDDAAGEAFDKVARVLSLPYPGGPNVQNLAKSGTANIPFPPSLAKGGDKFSFSGLKTSVINYCHGAEQKKLKINPADVAASFQVAALEPLIKTAVSECERLNVDCITVGGGVAANDYLRERILFECNARNIKAVIPEKKYCTDNAAMIAAEGLISYKAKNFSNLDLNARAYIELE